MDVEDVGGRRALIEGRTALRREVARILAGREIAGTLARIVAAGSEARYVACDITDAASVRAALGEVRRAWGPVAGVIHGAGVIADKAIADKPVVDFDAVYATKIGGWANLADALRDEPSLRLLCMFSSVSAKYGNAGQADYAMANETLNRIAADHARAHPGCRVKSICWGPWDGGMVDPALKRHFERAGIGTIGLEAGARALIEELSSDDGAVEVILREGDFLPETAARMTAVVDGERHHFLTDHRILGEPVLPVVLVQEWMARIARALMPGRDAVEIADLRVMKGAVLAGFPARTYRFDIAAIPAGSQAFDVKVSDETGQLRYTARVSAVEGNGESPPAPSFANGSAAPGASVYGDGRLFHGPAFQTVSAIAPVTAAGVDALIAPTAHPSWPATEWATDPGAVDGALQLAILWSHAEGRGLSLPLRIGRARILRQAKPGKPYQCRVRCRAVDAWRSEHDIALFLDGEPAILLSGVEFCRTRAELAA